MFLLQRLLQFCRCNLRRPPQLRSFVDGLVCKRNLCIEFAARRRQLARQRVTEQSFLLKRLTKLRRARRDGVARSFGVLHSGFSCFAPS